ncbi:MAG: glycosyltransferase family 4 protein [Chitinispirillaceae bacterium]|jgi:glycosyltransferase involved in cell wall biosynthesis|nr:glycosyltransferase family 4 protein [Chitinispirillaceae bacterium]
MKIAIDCRPLQNRYAGRGIGTVTRNLLGHLVRSRCSSSIVLCGKSPQPPLHCGAYHMLKRPDPCGWLQEQVRWPLDLIGIGASIFHSTVSLGIIRDINFPLVRPCKSIATVHDLTPMQLPGLLPHTRMKSYCVQRLAVRTADRIITPSSYVKNEIVHRLHVREEKVRVLPWAVDEKISRLFDRRDQVSLSDAEPFILAMGEDENKNITTVLTVFELLAARGYPGSLRIVGALGHQTDEVRRQYESSEIRERIVFTGTISPEHLVENYATCSLFFFPSLLEGFGLPVIEAMYCGAPVITAETSSLPEAGGDAAVYTPPADFNGMVTAAERLLNDPVYRRDVIEKGKIHAGRHTWAHAADMIVDLYEELGWKKKSEP